MKQYLSVNWIKNIIQNFLLSTISLLRITKNCRYRCTLPSISTGGQDIYILGNGPSINDNIVALKPILQSNACLCVNHFAECDLFEMVKPSYYLLLDPTFWLPGCLQRLIDARLRLYTILKQKTEWDLTLLVPVVAKQFVDWDSLFDENKNIKVVFFNSTPLTGFRWLSHRLYKFNLGMPHAQNVLVAAIFAAINIGYKHIYLLGADHSWHETLVLSDDNVVCLKDKHFYDDAIVKLVPWKKGTDNGDTWKMHEIFLAFSKMFEGYQYLEEYSKFRGTKIYNASTKTNIDAFTRCNLIKDNANV